MPKTVTTIFVSDNNITRLFRALCAYVFVMLLTLSMSDESAAQDGTVFFNQPGNYGDTLTDGMAGSANIPGISYQIYGANEAGNKVGTILVLAYTGFNLSHYFFVDDGSQMGIPFHKLVIESEGGEAFGFLSFNVFDELGEAPNYLITGFLDDEPVATQTQSVSSGADIVINMSPDFDNVDRVEITNTNGSLSESFNNFVFEAPEVSDVPLSSSPTLTFTQNSADITGNNIAMDGEGGSQSISDIDIQVFNISDEDGTFLNSLVWRDNSFIFSSDPTYSGLTYDNNNDGTKGMSIKSEDGSEFRLIQFTYYNWGESEPFTNTIKGFRNGTEVASMTFNGFDPGFNPMTITLDPSFSNVDDVRLFISGPGWAGDGTTNHTINNIQLTAPVSADPPTVSTDPSSFISATSVVLGGQVSDDGGEPVSARGIVWSTTDGFDPTTGHTEYMGQDTGTFNGTVGLLPFGTDIYFRAWAENSEGISYGDQRSFQTANSITAQLTGHEGWRLLSVPAGVSLAEFLAPIWTQGVGSGGNTPNGFPNVYTWNTASTDDTQSWWVPVTDLTHTTLDAGQGVLVYVFNDDNYNQTPDGFPKNLPISGSEFPGPVNASPLNSNENGLALSGNPFGSPVFWDDVATSGLHDAIYIWSPGETGGDMAYSRRWNR